MKIGIDCRMFSTKFTGIGRYTHEFVDHLIKMNDKRKKPDQLVLFFNDPEYHNFDPQNPNVKKILVNAKHYSLAEQIGFLKKLKSENLDIVHFPHFNVPILYRRPYVVTIHDLTLSFFPGKKMTKWYHRLAYNITIKNALKRAKKIIAVSHNTKNDLTSFLKIPEKKITVIHNGVGPELHILEDDKEIKQTLKKYNIDQPFLLYTGVWRSHKNLPRLIEAFALLKEKEEFPLKLVITGKPDPFYPEVKEAAKNNNLEKDVIFTGLVLDEELVHLYNAAHIYVFPSLYEGFGIPPLEAMACGTPVVASDGSSIPEVCGEDNAIFFDPFSVADIAEKIFLIHSDPELQKILIGRGLKRAEKFSWEKMAQQTYNLIRPRP